MNPDVCVLGILAKAPLPGQAKTRLACETSSAFAATLAEALLRDTVDRCHSLALRKVLLFTPDSSRPWFEALAPGAYDLETQAGGDLGERLTAFFKTQFDNGARRVVVIGSDSPDVPVAWLEQAFAALGSSDVILGPARDGGYYLIGLGRFVPSLFHIDGWGGPTVLEQTKQLIRQARCSMELLPPWSDVDTLEDCRDLKGRLANNATAPRTQALLSTLPEPER